MRQLANITVEIKGCVIAIRWHHACYLKAIRDMSNFVGISLYFQAFFLKMLMVSSIFMNITIGTF